MGRVTSLFPKEVGSFEASALSRERLKRDGGGGKIDLVEDVNEFASPRNLLAKNLRIDSYDFLFFRFHFLPPSPYVEKDTMKVLI